MPRTDTFEGIDPKHLNQFWVTYPSHFSEHGKVHNSDCKHFRSGHGRILTAPEIVEHAPKAENCLKCGGWGGV